MTKIKPHQYPAEVFWSDDDDGYIAIAPDLPGCSAWGANEAEAIAELRQAIQAWSKAASAAGNAIPAPSRPADPEQFSGKLLLRMPKRLHAELDRNARGESISLNQYVNFLLTEANTIRSVENRFIRISRFNYLAAARTFDEAGQQSFRNIQHEFVKKLAFASTVENYLPVTGAILSGLASITPLKLTT